MSRNRTHDGPGRPDSDSNKKSIYLPTAIIEQIQAEAQRQDRTFSWLVQSAWTLAHEKIKLLPGADGTLSK